MTTARLRVAIVTDFFPPDVLGGVEITAAAIVAHLRRAGHEVVVLTSALGTSPPQAGIHRVFHPYYRPERAARRRSAAGKLALDADTYWRARVALRRFAPTVVLVKSVRHISFRAVTAAFSLGVPVVSYADDDWLVTRLRACRTGGVAGRVREALIYGRFAFSTIACASHRLAEHFVDGGFPPGQVRALPHGVDPALFVSTPATTASRNLIFVGRLYPVKGPDIAIRAMRHLRDRGDRDVTLTIVGSGDREYRATLEREVEALGLSGAVVFAGNVLHDELPRRFADAFAVVMPSRYDTFPLVALEAMASARPLVAATVGGLPEIVTHGRNGLLVTPEDPQALADAIGQLLDDPALAAALGRAARETVLARFTEDVFFAGVEDILQRAVAPRALAS